jgi:hypothetical protein
MSENPETISPKRLEGRAMAYEGILRSRFGQRPFTADEKALKTLRAERSSTIRDAFGSEAPSYQGLRESQSAERNGRNRTSRLTGLQMAGMALAACFVFLLGIYWHHPHAGDPAVARVTATDPEIFIRRDSRDIPAAVGQELRSGDRIRLGSAEILEFCYLGEETIVELRGLGEARLSIKEGTKRIDLSGGVVLRGEVAHQPDDHPMIVNSRHAQAKVLGTRLQFSLLPHSTRLDVSEGKVRLSRFPDGSTVDVAKGYSAIVEKGTALEAEPTLLPDLVITDIGWMPTNPVAGDDVIFQATVKNQGKAATPPGIIIGVKFNVDDAPKMSWSDNYSNSLASGKSITLKANFGAKATNVWPARAGSHGIRATVDDINRIMESDEFNNVFSKNLHVR